MVTLTLSFSRLVSSFRIPKTEVVSKAKRKFQNNVMKTKTTIQSNVNSMLCTLDVKEAQKSFGVYQNKTYCRLAVEPDSKALSQTNNGSVQFAVCGSLEKCTVCGIVNQTYVSVHNRSFISARKPSYAQKNYLCGFSDSQGLSYDQTTP